MPASASRSSTDVSSEGGSAGSALGDPELRRFLVEYVKKRVPRSEVDDVVQTVFLDALASSKRPDDPGELRKWVVGIARHKCADVHRRSGRERPADDELPEQPAVAAPLEERSLVRWAEEQAQTSREAGKTLDWMAREGEGDKLEHIAEEEALPPARVRQRVSRMRRFLKERWLAEVALVAAFGALAILVWTWLRKDDEPIVADPTRPPPTSERPPSPEIERMVEGRRLRVGALEVCRSGEDRRCLDELDRARELDPTGDGSAEVREAREKAAGNLQRQEQERLDGNQKKTPEPTDVEEQKLRQDLLEKTPGPAPKKAPPKSSETSSPKKPLRSKEDISDFDGGSPDNASPPGPTAPPAPSAPLSAPPPVKEPAPSKAPAPATKGGKAPAKPQAPAFMAPPSQGTPAPQQRSVEKRK